MKLDSIKHEAFCQAYVNNPYSRYNGVKAYKEVYPDVKYNTAGTNSYELLKNTEIKDRIAELVEEVKENNIYETEKIKSEFWGINESFWSSQADRLRALEDIAKMNGLFIDKKKVEFDKDAFGNMNITVEIVKSKDS